jgi:hypothetical protein
MNARTLFMVAVAGALLLLAAACDVDFIAGPSHVKSGEQVQYQILIRPRDTGSASNATVHLAGDVPQSWALNGAKFQASIGGGASGSLTVHPSNPGVITGLPAVPPGHRRIYLSAGPFSTITADDRGTVLLDFTAAGAQGAYTMTFWAGVSTEPGDPESDESFSKPLRVTAPPPAGAILADGFDQGTVEAWTHRAGVDGSTVAYLRLDGDASDESSFGNHGSAIGGPTATADRFGNPGRALLFDGDDDQIILAHSASLNLTQAATLAAWIRPAPTGNHYVLGKINLAGSGFLYALDYLQGPAASRFRDAMGQAVQATGYLPVQTEEWQLLVFTWDGQHLVCYIDGVVEGHAESSTAAIGTNEGDVEIGSFEDARYRGAIDEVLIMDRALSCREVAILLP